MPLSEESKRVLAYAVEESERFSHKHVGSEHLVLGLLREEQSFAAELLREQGVQLATVREKIASPEFAARESASARREVSIVSIMSDPTGAEIEIDGKYLGNTPAEVPLLVGEREIRLSKGGYQTWERKLLVLPQARQNIKAELVKS